MSFCEKCISYDICEFHQDMFSDVFITFFPHNEECAFFKNKADVVEVVRCKDCKHYDGGRFCYYTEITVLDNDYCSYGERRDTP